VQIEDCFWAAGFFAVLWNGWEGRMVVVFGLLRVLRHLLIKYHMHQESPRRLS